MIMKHGLTATVAAILIAMSAQAEEQRTRLTVENAFPEEGQVEASLDIGFLEFGDNDEGPLVGDANLTRIAAQLRAGILPNLTAAVTIPYDSFSPDAGEDVNDLGDLEVGLYLKAFEDIFDYPYIIPYVTYDFGNGEPYLVPEGFGDETFTFGVSVGTVTADVLTWVLDFSYDINGETENSAVLGGSLFWDIDKQFSVGFEANVRENQSYMNATGATVENTPVLFQGTMVYQATRDLEFAVTGGGGKDRRLDSFAHFKTTYSF